MKRTNLSIASIFFILMFFMVACGKKDNITPKEDDLPDGEETPLNHPFTFKEGETGWKYEANSTLYEGETRVINSLESDKSFPLDFMGTVNQGYPGRGGFGFLPQKTGTFNSGYDFGKGNGTGGNNYYLTGSLIINGETYYAYSSHAYGFLEENRIEGADCTVTIIKYDMKYTTYKAFGMTLSGFIGVAEGLFAGTFKTADGSKSLEVTKGEFRVEALLPAGAEVIN